MGFVDSAFARICQACTVAGALVCLAPAPVQAAQCSGNSGYELKEPAICSRIVEFTGTCGHPNYSFPDWADVAVAVGSWEKTPIRILAISADAVVQTKGHTIIGSIFAGDSFNNDPLTPLRYATSGASDASGNVAAVLHTAQHFPVGLGMQLPAGQPWEHIHLDVHLTCNPVGAGYSGNLSVWYRLDK